MSISDTLSHLQSHWQTLSQRINILTQDIQTTTILLQRHGEIYRAPLNVLKAEKKDIKDRMKEIVTQVEEVKKAIEKSQQLVRKISRDGTNGTQGSVNSVLGGGNPYSSRMPQSANSSNLVYVKSLHNDPMGINAYVSRAAPM